jgi:hypothetical protein
MAALSFLAKNFAQQSENRIHSDEVASQYGFRGGLVPGVTSFAYVIEAVVAEFGLSWCDSGRLNMRLLQPVYEADVVTASCDAGGIVSLVDPSGAECVEGRASTTPVIYVGDVLGTGDVPHTRPAADAESLAPGIKLGTLRHKAAANHMCAYLESVNVNPDPWVVAKVWHPGVLLLDANDALSRNVLMGPWIHVGSDLSLFASVPLETPIETRSVVRNRYDRKGHEIVELDVTVHGQDLALVAHIHHTAIYKPRVNRS